MITTLLFIFASAFTASPQPTASAWSSHATEHFVIYYQPPQLGHVAAVARETERAYTRMSVALGHDLEEKVPVILVREDRDLPHNDGEAYALVRASNAGPHDHLMLSAETLDRHGDITIAHELTHQFVFELLPEANRDAPWVVEGLPRHYAGAWDATELVTVRDALTHGQVPAVETLTLTDQPWGHAMFDFVESEYGASGLRRYIAALRTGAPGNADAIRTAFTIPAHDFNAAFQSYVKTRFGSPVPSR